MNNYETPFSEKNNCRLYYLSKYKWMFFYYDGKFKFVLKYTLFNVLLYLLYSNQLFYHIIL